MAVEPEHDSLYVLQERLNKARNDHMQIKLREAKQLQEIQDLKTENILLKSKLEKEDNIENNY